MAKGNLEERLEELAGLARQPVTEETVQALRKALKDRTGLIVAQAAKVAGQLQRVDLIPELAQSFDRMLQKPLASDPKCWGKKAIVEALKSLDHSDSPLFLRGLAHIQMEPVWGGQEDTASALRASCALALVQCIDLSRRDKFRHLVDALADPAEAVRVDAARAIEQMDGDEALLLLRLKAVSGDAKPRVLGQVFESLLALEGEYGVPFLARFLESASDDVCEEAALALAASRLSAGLAALKQKYEKERGTPKAGIFLRALSVSGLPEALDFLVLLIREGSEMEMRAVVRAMEAYNQSAEIQLRVEQAKNDRRSRHT